MLFVKDNAVVGGVSVVGLAYQLLADGDLSSQSNDRDTDLVHDEAVDGVVNVARVGGMESTKDE